MKKNFKPKQCIICGNIFKPRSPTHIRCDNCASIKCAFCGKCFIPEIIAYNDGRKPKFCSTKCYHESTKRGEYRKCQECGREFYVHKCKIKTRKYCSMKCARKNRPPTPEYVRGKLRGPRVRKGIIKKCVTCGKEFYVEPSRINQSHCSLKCRPPVWNKGLKAQDDPRVAENTRRAGLANRGRPSKSGTTFKVEDPRISGKNHWNWKGGIHKKNSTERNFWASKGIYHNWRKAILKRDNYTCQSCGKRGGKLHVDHIKPWAKYPELRFDIDNGRVLCIPCHIKTDTYGSRSR